MVYILAAILVFGVLIAVHELGHFMAAKACGVRVNEFSIGMGPALWKKQKGETLYALRLFPVGGFCAMEGEEEDSDDPRSLNRQGFWAKLLIFAAGAAMNFLAGLLIILALYADAKAFYVPVIADFADGCPLESAEGLQTGDRLVSIDGERHTHLTYGERQRLNGLQTGVGIKHLYASLIAEVYLCLVTDERCHLAVNAHTGVAHLKAPFALRGLIFIFAAKGSMNMWRAVHLVVI